MKVLTFSRLFLIGAMILGLAGAYGSIMPNKIDGMALVGNSCSCNWSEWYTCPTSEGASKECENKYCETGGDGSGEINGPYTYCSGAVNCDQKQGYTCSKGNNCTTPWN